MLESSLTALLEKNPKRVLADSPKNAFHLTSTEGIG